ncbi:PAS-domain containing protein [uncultured Litoreibacter sp.]|uniref:PAS-domain containing protein n=1 Tax=uncultured Litoreibacter sp. TaxID=1392394 RepID=UPI002613708F|nr:PAS-domain containing protein [uncultured Litoreibacter sp.]
MLQSADSYHRSRDTSVLLRSGLNLIQQALSIYSDDLTLTVSNQRFRAMFGLPAHLSEPGAKFSDTIEFLANAGEYGDVKDIPAFIEERVEKALTFKQHYMERQRSNGRWVSIEGGPLRQGGWVTVYTDITDIKRQEEMLRTRSDELSDRLLDRSEELARTNRALEATISRLHETQQHLEAAEARVRLAAETTPAHIARLDLQERYTYSNHRLPFPPSNGAADIIDHTAQDVLGALVYQQIAPALHSALAGKAKVVEFTSPNDGRHIRSAFTPDTNDTNTVTGAYVLSMDITNSHQDTPSTAKETQSSAAQFGAWIARFDLFELHSNTSEKVITLTLAEATLLRLFLSMPNRMLTRQDIFDAPSVQLNTARALDIRISRLRQKLGDDAKSPKLIRTIYGAGYIFVGEVEWLD